jgi:hypothetical protein
MPAKEVPMLVCDVPGCGRMLAKGQTQTVVLNPDAGGGETYLLCIEHFDAVRKFLKSHAQPPKAPCDESVSSAAS